MQSFTRALSEKWNTVRGSNKTNIKNSNTMIDTNNKVSIVDDVDEGIVLPLQSSTTTTTTNQDEEESTHYNGYSYCVAVADFEETTTVPEAVLVVSDTAIISEDEDDFDSSSDETDAAEKYGYGDAAPDTNTHYHLLTKAFPKRLSTREDSMIQRRRNSSTMCHQKSLSFRSEHHGNYVDYLSDPHRAPRRSSIEGSCPQRARARRRASIAACTATPNISIVPGRRRESLKRRSSIKSLASVTMLALVALPAQCATAAPQMLRSTRIASPTTSVRSSDGPRFLRGVPSMEPSYAPSEMPTFADTDFPVSSETPTESPTFNPTFTPTVYPSEVPSSQPFRRTAEPTTMEPSTAPSEVPTFADTEFPTPRRVRTPTPTTSPTRTAEPTTMEPSHASTFVPTVVADTEVPSEAPTFNPTFTPTVYPSEVPSSQPISRTAEPTTMEPSTAPSETPTFANTDFPTRRPPRTQTPTTSPTGESSSEVVICVDSKELRHNNKKKKNCDWVGKKKVKERCKKKWGDEGKKLYDACPLTCLPKGLGSCVDL